MAKFAAVVVGGALAVVMLPVVVALGVTGTVAAEPTVPAAPGPGGVALAWALQQVGKPYQWGAAGPDAFDCSGLVLRAWQAAGVALPRVAADQYGAGSHVAISDLRSGDLVFWASNTAQPSTIYHVAMYIGGGQIVQAPHTGAVVSIAPIGGTGFVNLATRP